MRKRQFFILFCLTVFIFAYGSNLHALPEGEVVVSGAATFDRTTQDTLNINTPSNKLIVNYTSFSIAQPETVNFYQPSSSAIALNRVVGIDPSSIFGKLTANGRIFLINPNGIVFGPSSQIDVAGLVASTLDISNEDFLNDNFIFNKSQSKSGASILNQGYIRAKEGGLVALLGSAVENSGLIETSFGSVVLAAGEKITLNLDTAGMISVVIDEPVKEVVFGPDGERIDSAIKNSGEIIAPGSKVTLAASVLDNIFDYAINNSGIIEAKSLVNHYGVVELVAEGAPVINTGKIVAGEVRVNVKDYDFINKGEIISDGSAELPDGGRVSIEAATILQQGHISANAQEFGTAGEIIIISQTSTTVDTGSTTEARALGLVGNGGKILIDSLSGNTVVNTLAVIDVSAGSIAGNAGFIEISAFEQLGFYGILSGRAPPGYRGLTAIFDPQDDTIATNVPDDATVIVWATRHITIGANIQIGNNAKLYLLADHQSGSLDDWDTSSGKGTGAIQNSSDYTISAASGASNTYLYLRAGSGIGSTSHPVKTNVDNIDAKMNPNHGSGGIYINQGSRVLTISSVTTRDGEISITTANSLNANSIIAGGNNRNITLQATTGDITVGTVTASEDDVSITASAGSILDGNADSNNITADNLTLVANTGIGASDDLEVDLDDSLTVQTNNSDVNIDFGSGKSLSFLSGVLNASDAEIDISVENTGGSIAVGVVNVGNNDDVTLIASAAITDNNAGSNNITASNLTLSAATGIGSSDALETQVSKLKATNTSSGNIQIDNTGNLNLNNFGSGYAISQSGGGDVDISAGSQITVEDSVIVNDGGNITLTANDIDITKNAEDAISAANITLKPANANTTIGIGGNFNDFRITDNDLNRLACTGTVTIGRADGTGAVKIGDINLSNAGSNKLNEDYNLVILGGTTTVDGSITMNTDKSITMTANNANLTLNSSRTITTTGTGIVSLTAGGLNKTLTLSGNVSAAGGITYTADKTSLTGTTNAGSNNAVLKPYTNGQLINLGGSDADGTLGLTNTELNKITAGQINIGDVNSGTISITTAINLTNTNSLSLTTGGSIIDSNSSGIDITVSNLILFAATGIGSGDALETRVSNLTASSTSGNIEITNSGDITVNGLSTTNGNIIFINTGEGSSTYIYDIYLDNSEADSRGLLTITTNGYLDIEPYDNYYSIEAYNTNVEITNNGEGYETYIYDVYVDNRIYDEEGNYVNSDPGSFTVETNGYTDIEGWSDYCYFYNTDVSITNNGTDYDTYVYYLYIDNSEGSRGNLEITTNGYTDIGYYGYEDYYCLELYNTNVSITNNGEGAETYLYDVYINNDYNNELGSFTVQTNGYTDIEGWYDYLYFYNTNLDITNTSNSSTYLYYVRASNSDTTQHITISLTTLGYTEVYCLEAYNADIDIENSGSGEGSSTRIYDIYLDNSESTRGLLTITTNGYLDIEPYYNYYSIEAYNTNVEITNNGIDYETDIYNLYFDNRQTDGEGNYIPINPGSLTITTNGYTYMEGYDPYGWGDTYYSIEAYNTNVEITNIGEGSATCLYDVYIDNDYSELGSFTVATNGYLDIEGWNDYLYFYNTNIDITNTSTDRTYFYWVRAVNSDTTQHINISLTTSGYTEVYYLEAYNADIDIENTGVADTYLDSIYTSDGNITLTADSFTIAGYITSDIGDITIKNYTVGKTFDIGSAGIGDIVIDEDEIDYFSAAGKIIIGSDTAGTLYVGTADFGAFDLTLISGNMITNVAGTITADNLSLFATNGIGEADNYLHTNVNTLSAETTGINTNIYIDEDNDLFIDTIIAGSDAEEEDDLGDAYLIVGGWIRDTGGTITADSLNLIAATGIGESTNPLNTEVNTLSAETTADGADIFLNEADDLVIDTITAGTEDERGDVELTASGSINSIGGTSSHIVSSALYLEAGQDIGTSSALYTQVEELWAQAGRDIGYVEIFSAGITNIGDLNLKEVVAGGQAAIKALSDIIVGSVIAEEVGLVASGSIYAIGSGPHIEAALTSYLSSPNGVIGTLSNPLNILISGGDLVLDIGGTLDSATGSAGTLGVSGSLSGAVSGSISFDPNSFSPLYPPGYVFFNGGEIWPSLPPPLIPMAGNYIYYILGSRFTWPVLEQLQRFSINTMDLMTSVYFYHPVTSTDTEAFEGFQLTDEMYEYIEGTIRLREEGLFPWFEEEIKKRRGNEEEI